MASAWGGSWGSAWLNSWGQIAAIEAPKSSMIAHHEQPRRNAVMDIVMWYVGAQQYEAENSTKTHIVSKL